MKAVAIGTDRHDSSQPLAFSPGTKRTAPERDAGSQRPHGVGFDDVSKPSDWVTDWRFVYVAAWLLFFSLYSAVFVAHGLPLALALRHEIAHLLPNFLLGILILSLPARMPWPDVSRSRFFLVHAGLLAAFILICVYAWFGLIGVDARLFDGAFRVEIKPGALMWRIVNDVLIYSVLAGLAYAGHNAALGRAEAARAARAEGLRVRAELEAMRSQLNPHFILNTLHALIGLVQRNPRLAEEALERLGDLLRYGLSVQSEARDEVSLREEWAFVQSYLELERLRLGDRLQTDFRMQDEALECRVPCFSVQILVENAIRHAIAPRPDGGRLAVTAWRAGDVLRIEVEDDGNEQQVAGGNGEKGGIGLRLLRERLAVLHEGRASLSLQRHDHGTTALLEIPLESSEESQ